MARVTVPLESPLDDPRYKTRVTRSRNAYDRCGQPIWEDWNNHATGAYAVRTQKIAALRGEFGFGPFDFVNSSTCDRYDEYRERSQVIQAEYSAAEAEMNAAYQAAQDNWVLAFIDKRVNALGEEWRPFIEGIMSLDVEGGGPREYMDEKIAIAEACPATPLMLDAVAREYNWCGVYSRMKRKAREEGLIDVLRKLTGVPHNAAKQAQIVGYATSPEFARWVQEISREPNRIWEQWTTLLNANYAAPNVSHFDVATSIERARSAAMHGYRSEHIFLPLLKVSPGLAQVYADLTRYSDTNIGTTITMAVLAHLLERGATTETLHTVLPGRVGSTRLLDYLEDGSAITVRLDAIQAERGIA